MGRCVLWLNTKPLQTRRTTVATAGTGSPNHFPRRVPGSISSTIIFPHFPNYRLKHLIYPFISEKQKQQLDAWNPSSEVQAMLKTLEVLNSILYIINRKK